MTLTAAIDSLYTAFADLPKPADIACCPCCVTEDERATMIATPLRQLRWNDLVSYVTSARPQGYIPDYLHFLPRIMELAATDSGWWPDPYVICNRIEQTDPALWTPARRQAWEDFLHALIEHLLSPEEEDLHAVDDWLCAIASIDIDVRPFLALIARSEEHILEYYNHNAGTLSSKNRLSNAFWNRPNAGHDHIVAWFASPPASDVLHRAYRIILPNPNPSPT